MTPSAQSTHSTPGQVMGRLEDIEQALALRANDHEEAASDRAYLTRMWDRRLAEKRVTAQGSDAEARKAQALLHAINEDDLYERLSDAEARFAACQAAQKSDETRAMIGMAILRAQGRA